MTNVITLKNIFKSYSKQTPPWAVENLNLEIREGEFFCIVGPSGGGKTTILKMIGDLEQPTTGKILKPENISMVFQSGALLPWLTALQNVEFGLKMNGISENSTREIASRYLHLVNLEFFHNKYPRELSGGQRQRVGIARALAVSPQILLLDEPFSALDSLTSQELYKDLLSIWQETKITIVMISHLLEEAVFLADRIGVIKEGHLKEIVEINLPRPRSNENKNFFSQVDTIRGLL